MVWGVWHRSIIVRRMVVVNVVYLHFGLSSWLRNLDRSLVTLLVWLSVWWSIAWWSPWICWWRSCVKKRINIGVNSWDSLRYFLSLQCLKDFEKYQLWNKVFIVSIFHIRFLSLYIQIAHKPIEHQIIGIIMNASCREFKSSQGISIKGLWVRDSKRKFYHSSLNNHSPFRKQIDYFHSSGQKSWSTNTGYWKSNSANILSTKSSKIN